MIRQLKSVVQVCHTRVLYTVHVTIILFWKKHSYNYVFYELASVWWLTSRVYAMLQYIQYFYSWSCQPVNICIIFMQGYHEGIWTITHNRFTWNELHLPWKCTSNIFFPNMKLYSVVFVPQIPLIVIVKNSFEHKVYQFHIQFKWDT